MNRQQLLLRQFYDVMERERRYMVAEVVKVGGLMPLLMKQRNKQKWSAQDKRELMLHLRHLRHVSPYIAVLVLPGGFAALPVLAWWLDRRRGRRPMAGSQASS
ncbi:MAG: hypothetical protein HY661_18575 [Betaproteobacteria bacterium]|nr:hypothetical protein [Betaproteobacteria bacterium]